MWIRVAQAYLRRLQCEQQDAEDGSYLVPIAKVKEGAESKASRRAIEAQAASWDGSDGAGRWLLFLFMGYPEVESGRLGQVVLNINTVLSVSITGPRR
jgi:hypothetical protein